MAEKYNNNQEDNLRMSRVERREEQHEEKIEQKKKHPVLKGFLIFFTMFLFVTGAYAVRLLAQTQNALDKSYTPVVGRKNPLKIIERKPINILLLGADTGGEGRTDQGNSDTIIVATINPKTKKTKLTSVPRDTLAEIKVPDSNKTDLAKLDPGSNGFVLQKINSAYNLGGAGLTIKTVEKQLDIPIDYYVQVDFSSLSKIVDGVGGIDVNVPFSFTSGATGGQYFAQGWQHLNGEYALAYARMRHEDPEGDYGRQKRQRQVIQAILKSAMSINSLTHYKELLDSVSDSMKTDMKFRDMMLLVALYRNSAKNMDSDYIQGKSFNIAYANYPYGLSVEVPSSEELNRVSNSIRKSYGLESKDLKSEIIRQNRLNERHGVDFNGPDNQKYFLYEKFANIKQNQDFV